MLEEMLANIRILDCLCLCAINGDVGKSYSSEHEQRPSQFSPSFSKKNLSTTPESKVSPRESVDNQMLWSSLLAAAQMLQGCCLMSTSLYTVPALNAFESAWCNVVPHFLLPLFFHAIRFCNCSSLDNNSLKYTPISSTVANESPSTAALASGRYSRALGAPKYTGMEPAISG
jgi:hypothetical protein